MQTQDITTPLVSVWMITYNHEPFIAQAIESVLMQKTNFSFELVIGEDGSTDKTADIVKQYADIYPNIIKARFNNPNIGVSANLIKTLEECKGKYIAMLEGDDYWINDQKLQKQVDYLEKNKNVSVCFHKYDIIDNDTGKITSIHQPELNNLNEQGLMFTIENFGIKWYYQTLTAVFRADAIKNYNFRIYKYFRDTHLFFHLLEKGDGYIFKDTWGIYRAHQNGIFSKKHFLEMKRYALLTYDEISKNNSLSKQYIRKAFLINRNQYEQTIVQTLTNNHFKFKQDNILLHIKTYLHFKKEPFTLTWKLLTHIIQQIFNRLFKK